MVSVFSSSRPLFHLILWGVGGGVGGWGVELSQATSTGPPSPLRVCRGVETVHVYVSFI